MFVVKVLAAKMLQQTRLWRKYQTWAQALEQTTQEKNSGFALKLCDCGRLLNISIP